MDLARCDGVYLRAVGAYSDRPRALHAGRSRTTGSMPARVPARSAARTACGILGRIRIFANYHGGSTAWQCWPTNAATPITIWANRTYSPPARTPMTLAETASTFLRKAREGGTALVMRSRASVSTSSKVYSGGVPGRRGHSQPVLFRAPAVRRPRERELSIEEMRSQRSMPNMLPTATVSPPMRAIHTCGRSRVTFTALSRPSITFRTCLGCSSAWACTPLITRSRPGSRMLRRILGVDRPRQRGRPRGPV